MKNLLFSKNDNNKLFCPCFTTIRLFVKDRYTIGEELNVHARINSIEYMLGVAKIAAIEKYKLTELPQSIIFFDSEKTPAQFIEYFFTVYETYINKKYDMYCTVLYLVWKEANHTINFSINKEFILPIA